MVSDDRRTADDGDESLEIDEETERLFWRRYHLGAIAETSASMEMTLRAVFAALLGSPRASVVAAGQGVVWLVENAIAVIDTNDQVRGPSLGEPEAVARFRRALTECGALYKKRNQLIHGGWVEGGPDLSQVRSKYRQPLPFAVKVTQAELETLSEELSNALGELMSAGMEVKGVVAGT